MKYKFEVQADRDESWAGNGIVYESKERAELAARNLEARWTLVKAWRVVEIDENTAAR